MSTKRAQIKVTIDALRVVTHAYLTDAGITTTVSLVLGHSVIADITFKNGIFERSNIYLELPKTIIKAHNLEHGSDIWHPSHMPISFCLAHMYIWYKEGEVEYYREMRDYAETMKQYHAKKAAKYNG